MITSLKDDKTVAKEIKSAWLNTQISVLYNTIKLNTTRINSQYSIKYNQNKTMEHTFNKQGYPTPKTVTAAKLIGFFVVFGLRNPSIPITTKHPHQSKEILITSYDWYQTVRSEEDPIIRGFIHCRLAIMFVFLN